MVIVFEINYYKWFRSIRRGDNSVRTFYDDNNSFFSNDPSMCTKGTMYKMPNSADFKSDDWLGAESLVSNFERA